MKVLVACEFSGVVREAFKARGHDAWSCDLLPTEILGNHIQDDVLKHLNDGWDLMIAHPPCTYLSYVGTRHWNKPGRKELRDKAMQFFLAMVNAPIKRICVENPYGLPCNAYRKPDQIINPYFFGESVRKRTCLWLKNLKHLQPTHLLAKPEPLYICQGEKTKGKKINWVEGIKGVKNRSHERSRTFKGIAQAMAEQWG